MILFRMYFEIAFFAYLIDKLFGEFRFISFYRHPVIFMGDYIKWFENYFYKDSVVRGIVLNITLLGVIFLFCFLIDTFIENIFILALIASTGLASKMLYESVKDILSNPENIKYLVSRDTKGLSESDINKAALETYSENMSDGVVAPLFYLLLFGIYGLFIYKGINTLDSMVGYKNKRYEKFGKFSALFDDGANFIPARITAIIIGVLFFSKKALREFSLYGKKHDSPNAGYPISAFALSLNVSLGGPTSYFGKIKEKPYFGDGKKDITKDDLEKGLDFQLRFDILIVILLIIGIFLNI